MTQLANPIPLRALTRTERNLIAQWSRCAIQDIEALAKTLALAGHDAQARHLLDAGNTINAIRKEHAV